DSILDRTQVPGPGGLQDMRAQLAREDRLALRPVHRAQHVVAGQQLHAASFLPDAAGAHQLDLRLRHLLPVLGVAERGPLGIEILRIDRLLVDDLIQLGADRKSTRLNSSHVKNSYAVFCLIKINETYRWLK